jgi:CAAX protease family protein
MILTVGDAQLRLSPGTASIHAAYGIAWLLGEIIGAAGEEVLFRGLILVLASRLFGVRIAIVISALAFSLAHGANPGTRYIWMVRLAAAGMLLAYSVVRSGTLWWGIGYHAGWNFASAPLFGAVGSGYLDQGHIFSFLPSGNPLVTGGPVGPEGSAFAFLAVVIGFGFLILTVHPNEGDLYLEH